jgi:hypothetical protein
MDKVPISSHLPTIPPTNPSLHSSLSAPVSPSAPLATPGPHSRRSCTLKTTPPSRALPQRPPPPSRAESALPLWSCLPVTTTPTARRKSLLPPRSPRLLLRLRLRPRARERPPCLRMKMRMISSRSRARALRMTMRRFE